jgi:hypothetical protein
MRAHLSVQIVLLLITGSLVGCVQRTISIETDPVGALVYLNDEEVGRTPVTVPFTFYGVYDIRIEKEGYQTLSTERETKAPLYEYPGPDLVTELMPWTTRVNYDWQFELEPYELPDEGKLVDRARQMRALANEQPQTGE